MPKDGFKDRIYYVEQETDEECNIREFLKTEEERVERMRSNYGKLGRAYGTWVPETRSKVEDATEAEQ